MRTYVHIPKQITIVQNNAAFLILEYFLVTANSVVMLNWSEHCLEALW